jgi:hypothetical protein
MDIELNELPVSCLSSSKLDKQLRRQVKRVTSVAVMLMRVVSPVLLKKKSANICNTGKILPDSGGSETESTPTVERIVQCVLENQVSIQNQAS